jgi:uncharacterized protein YceK
MRNICILVIVAALAGACGNVPTQEESKKMLRHVVMFGFNDEATVDQVKEIETAFANLPKQIDVIKGYEWGTDCSPEGLQQGHTHCFFLSFESEKDRDTYLVHPAHQEFGKLLGGKLKTVTVVDYWMK